VDKEDAVAIPLTRKKKYTGEVKLKMIQYFSGSNETKETEYDVDYERLGCDKWDVYCPERFPLVMESTGFMKDITNIIFDYAHGMYFQYKYFYVLWFGWPRF